MLGEKKEKVIAQAFFETGNKQPSERIREKAYYHNQTLFCYIWLLPNGWRHCVRIVILIVLQ